MVIRLLQKIIMVMRTLCMGLHSLVQGLMYVAFCWRKLPTGAREERLVVLLTGPSIMKDMNDVSNLIEKGWAAMGVNSFALNSEFNVVRPKYYSIYDRSFFLEDGGTQVSEMLGGSVKWDMNLFVPMHAKSSDFCKALEGNEYINIIYVRYFGFDYNCYVSRWFASKGVAMSRCYNVLVWALFVCGRLGGREIKIAGADFDLHKGYEAIGYRKSGRNGKPFYQTSNEKGNYAPDMAESLQTIVLAYRALYFIDDVFRLNGVKVSVITKGTGIDCFR